MKNILTDKDRQELNLKHGDGAAKIIGRYDKANALHDAAQPFVTRAAEIADVAILTPDILSIPLLLARIEELEARSATAGAQGPKGDKGDKGDTGATGPQGPAGAPGTVKVTA
jgi:hypothetical protein